MMVIVMAVMVMVFNGDVDSSGISVNHDDDNLD